MPLNEEYEKPLETLRLKDLFWGSTPLGAAPWDDDEERQHNEHEMGIFPVHCYVQSIRRSYGSSPASTYRCLVDRGRVILPLSISSR